jgi:hypothetical protein
MTAATRRGRSADRLPGRVGGGPSVVDSPRLVSRWKGPRPMARRLSPGHAKLEPRELPDEPRTRHGWPHLGADAAPGLKSRKSVT